MFLGPGPDRRGGVRTPGELDGPALRHLDGAGDPGPATRELLQRLVPVDVVDEHARRRIALGRIQERPPEKDLELPQALAVRPQLVGRLFELPAVVYGQHAQLFGLVAGRRAVEVIQPRVVPQAMRLLFQIQEILELVPGGHGRGAPVPGDDDCAAGVAEAQARLQGLLAQPAAQEAAHKGVAGADGVEDLDGEAWHPDAVFEVVRDLPGEDYRPHRADLEHDGRLREPADAQERLARLGGAAGYPDLLLGPDHEVAVRQHGTVDLRHLLAGDEHLAALLVGGHAPEDGPVVEVEGHPASRPPSPPRWP